MPREKRISMMKLAHQLNVVVAHEEKFKLKVALLIKGLGLGGAERHVVDLAIALKDKGYTVTVFYILTQKRALVGELEKNQISVECLGMSVWWIFILPRTLKAFRTLRPDVVHAHLPIPAVIARVLKPLFEYRLVCTEHNMFARLHPGTRFIHKCTHFLDDSSISCSNAVGQSLPWKSAVIDNGIVVPECCSKIKIKNGLRTGLNISDESIVFICVANLWKKKNHRLLIESFNIAFENTPRGCVDLVIVGQDGTEREALERLAHTLPTRSHIHFFGGHPNASKLLHEADVFCLSSTFEGLPIALLESMAVGMPSVVTNVGGMSYAVRDGQTGLVIEPNDVEGYSIALSKMFFDCEMRASMGVRAHAWALENFSQEKMVSAIIDEYLPARLQ